MTIFGLCIAYLRDRKLNTLLNILLLTLGVATLVLLLLFSRQLEGRLERDAQGIDLVVGANRALWGSVSRQAWPCRFRPGRGFPGLRLVGTPAQCR